MIRIDTRQLAADMRHLEAAITSSARQSLGQGAAYALELARRTSKFRDRTGNLRGSLKRGKRGPWSFFVQAGGRGVRYAGFVEYGTRRMSARNFMRDARDQAETALVRFVAAGINRAVQG